MSALDEATTIAKKYVDRPVHIAERQDENLFWILIGKTLISQREKDFCSKWDIKKTVGEHI